MFIRRCDQNHPVGTDRMADGVRVLVFDTDHRQVEEPVLELLDHAAAVTLVHLKVDLRVKAAVAGQKLGQNIGRGDRRGADVDDAVLLGGAALDDAVLEIQNILRVGEDLLPGRGELERLRGAGEKLTTEPFFKLADVCADLLHAGHRRRAGFQRKL